jgi:ribonucleoside-diphosphate reductase alpha chain
VKLRNVSISDNAKKILLDRYVLKTADGKLLENSFEDVMRRIARTVASKLFVVGTEVPTLKELQNTETEFYNLLISRAFLPNSPTIFNFGKGVDIELFRKPVEEMTEEDYEKVEYQSSNRRNMGSACFVQDIDDSMDSIFNAVHDAAITQKYGGGVGFNFSKLRPSNAPVGGTSGLASGPISFMHVINHATEAVDQGGVR